MTSEMPETAAADTLDDPSLLARLRQEPARWLPTVLQRYEAPLLRHAGEIEGDTIRPRFEEASPRFQLTVIAARFAEHLRKSRWVAREESLHDVLELAGSLPPATVRTPEAQGLVGLIRDAVRLPGKAED